MNWLTSNLIETLLIVGISLLVIEILILGFSTFFLFFAGLASLLTALLIWIGILPDDVLVTLIAVASFTALFAITLWRPLSKLQKSVDRSRPNSDLIGHFFTLSADISGGEQLSPPTYQFSGIEWKLQSTQNITKGSMVVITQVDVEILWVEKTDKD